MAKQKYTVDELLEMLVEAIGNPFEVELSQDEIVSIISQWGQVDGSNELLHGILGRDVINYWKAKSDLERENVRGGFTRTAWIRGVMRKANELKMLNESKKKREV